MKISLELRMAVSVYAILVIVQITKIAILRPFKIRYIQRGGLFQRAMLTAETDELRIARF